DQGGMQGQCPIYAISMNVDANHDGIVNLNYGGPDTTSAITPMRFWINNDSDGATIVGTEKHVSKNTKPDSENAWIQSIRDLEDFARLYIEGMPSIDALGGYKVALHWRNIIFGHPAIKLFSDHNALGGVGYLTDTSIAQSCVGDPLADSCFGEVTES